MQMVEHMGLWARPTGGNERHFVFFCAFHFSEETKKQETHGETTQGRQRDRHGRRGKTRREGDRETVGREPKGVCREIEETEGKPEGDIKRERVRKRSARRCPTRKNQGFPHIPDAPHPPGQVCKPEGRDKSHMTIARSDSGSMIQETSPAEINLICWTSG